MPLQPRRLFVFGCSFTKWMYPTWSDILATHLSPIEYFNYGAAGAGNQFIFTKLIEADMVHSFDETDMVIVQWTNISREDRYSEKTKSWVTPGNIYTQTMYNEEFIKEWANDSHYAAINFSLIKSANDIFCNKTNFTNLQMLDLSKKSDQWSPTGLSDQVSNLVDIFDEFLSSQLQDSFYDVLWNGDLDNKISLCNNIHDDYSDYHPTIEEHAKYISSILNISWSDELLDIINTSQAQYERIVKAHLDSGNLYNTLTTLRAADLEEHIYSRFSKSVELDATALISI